MRLVTLANNARLEIDAKSLLLTVYRMMLSQKHHLESTMAAPVDEVMVPL